MLLQGFAQITFIITSMKEYDLDHMVKGWFVGDFTPTVIKSQEFEVAVKHYKKGDYEPSHYHKIATEVTVICSGSVKMNGKEHQAGSIIVIEPNEDTDFFALEDTITCVVKTPSAKSDKYNI